jgi:predicted AAA+ superfamily ATPase
VPRTAAKIRGPDVPQKPLQAVRQVVTAVGTGATDTAAVATSSGLKSRAARYALLAARTLGLVKGSRNWSLAPLGRDLLRTEPGSQAERSRLRQAIETSPVLRRLAPGLLGRRQQSERVIAGRIAKIVPDLTSSETIQRRARELLGWRSYVLDPQLRLDDLSLNDRVKPGSVTLSEALLRALRRMNPWWNGLPGPPVPSKERDFVAQVERRLHRPIAPIVAVRGPRQVGKTTAQLQLIARLLAQGFSARRLLRVQFDDLESLVGIREPILRIVEWYEAEILGTTLNAAAREGQPALLLLDEVQNLTTWATELKHLVDTCQVRVFVTGSSALRIEKAKDSLAGRLHSINVGTLTLREIARIRYDETLEPVLENGGERLAERETWERLKQTEESAVRGRAFAAFGLHGGYPLVHTHPDLTWSELAQQLNENVVERVIQHDLRIGDRGRSRDPALLRELFRLCCRYAGQAPGLIAFVREARRMLGRDLSADRVGTYLDFLESALLVRQVRPLEMRLKRAQGSAKLCLVDHGLRASFLQEEIPLDVEGLAENPHLTDIAGHLAESVVGAYLLGISGLQLAHFPARSDEPEVDFVLVIGARRVPIEVKYRRRVEPLTDTEGLRTFLEKSAHRAEFGVLVTPTDVEIADPRIVSISLPKLLSLY